MHNRMEKKFKLKYKKIELSSLHSEKFDKNKIKTKITPYNTLRSKKLKRLKGKLKRNITEKPD